MRRLNCFLDVGDLLLITFANSLDPGWSRSGSKPFDTLIEFLKDFLIKLNLKIMRQQTTTKHEKLPSMQLLKSNIKTSVFEMQALNK